MKYETIEAGLCRCLAALAEWSRLTNECRKEWKHAEPHVRRDMAGLAAHAAWHMGQWEEMAAYTHEMRTNDTSTGSFLLAVQAVHNQNLDAAKGRMLCSLLSSSERHRCMSSAL